MYERLYRACIRTAALWPRQSPKHEQFMGYARIYLRRIHERKPYFPVIDHPASIPPC